MNTDKILTLHPSGKSGRNISRQSYELLKQAILAALNGQELTHTELFRLVNQGLKGKFDGNISWYAETVKLDLEARQIIERTAEKPARYRIADQAD